MTGTPSDQPGHPDGYTPRHDARCLDEEGVLDDCICGLDPLGAPDTYHPDDHEPMGGDPWWSQENDR